MATTDLARQEVAPMSLSETLTIAEHLARCGYFRDAADVSKAVAKLLVGRELGIGAMASMMGVQIVQGNPALSAGLIGALVLRSGRYRYEVDEASDATCRLSWYRDGVKIGESSFTFDEAKRAGLASKDVWKNYPSDLCFARALTRGARRFCPDVFLGAVYTPEELGASVDGATGEVLDVPSRAALPGPSTAATNGHAAAEPEPHYSDEIDAIATTNGGLALIGVIATTTTGHHRSGALRKCMHRMACLARDEFDIELLRGALESYGGLLCNGDRQEVFEAGQEAKARIGAAPATKREGVPVTEAEAA